MLDAKVTGVCSILNTFGTGFPFAAAQQQRFELAFSDVREIPVHAFERVPEALLEVREDAARVPVRSESAPGDHTREGASGLRRRPQPFLEDDGLSRRETRTAAVSIRLLQQESFPRGERLSRPVPAIPEEAA